MNEDLISNWGQNLTAVSCENCDWLYLLSPEKLPLTCPHCGVAEVEELEGTSLEALATQPPELMLPFSVPQPIIESYINRFVGGNWFAPKDLDAAKLISRLQPIYMPMWLVDADVKAQWQAEVGFDYQIVTHQERHKNGQWQTQKFEKTRIRWEPRVGQIDRHYENTTAPALEDHREMIGRLGKYTRQKAEPYQPSDGLIYRLPNRPPDDAWGEAETVLHKIARNDCQRATGGDHIRDFHWAAHYANHHWTQLLLPLYSTFYLDDNGQPYVVLVNGQTGELNGRKRASMKRALDFSKIVGVIAALLFILGLILTNLAAPTFISYGQQATSFSHFALLIAAAPIIFVWHFNRTN